MKNLIAFIISLILGISLMKYQESTIGLILAITQFIAALYYIVEYLKEIDKKINE
jgi:hypothetical protein